MTTYVLGAGASHGAGYPLASRLLVELFDWMKNSPHEPNSYASRYPETARYFEGSFGEFRNIEILATEIQKQIEQLENGTREQRVQRTVLANEYGVLKNALRAWFMEIQRRSALTGYPYQEFAKNVVAAGDRIVTFNYDVSLERELKLAAKFEVGDGYGFRVENLPAESPTRVLKLHGSTSWLALLFGGITSGPFSFEPGNILSSPPVIPKNELSFMGYPADAIDPRFARGGAAIPVMIFPARSTEYYFASNTGTEYTGFWNDLWEQARVALRTASRVVICGYSLQGIEERARNLLLGAPGKNAEIVIASGNDTENIVREYRNQGYGRATAAEEVSFEKWVRSSARAPAMQ
jgi:hypothetical protein